MANTVIKLIDSQKRVVFKLSGDGVGESGRVLKIDAGGLNFALNANGYILGTGTDRKSKYRLYLKKAYVTVDAATAGSGGANNGGGHIELSTDGDQSNVTLRFGEGGYTFDFHDGGGDSLVIPMCEVANTTGNVWMQCTGFGANGSYMAVLDFRKDPNDYDQGQTADPVAFNRLVH